MKLCRGCGELKQLDAYYKEKRSGVQSRCKKCQDAKKREWLAENRERQNEYDRTYRQKYPERVREKSRRWRLKWKSANRWIGYRYGITAQEYDALLASQGEKCGICGCLPERAGRYGKLSVDHAHETGLVRGLLCDQCNRGLGAYSDSPMLLRRAADYLEEMGQAEKRRH